jgi:hypothetical protein
VVEEYETPKWLNGNDQSSNPSPALRLNDDLMEIAKSPPNFVQGRSIAAGDGVGFATGDGVGEIVPSTVVFIANNALVE